MPNCPDSYLPGIQGTMSLHTLLVLLVVNFLSTKTEADSCPEVPLQTLYCNADFAIKVVIYSSEVHDSKWQRFGIKKLSTFRFKESSGFGDVNKKYLWTYIKPQMCDKPFLQVDKEYFVRGFIEENRMVVLSCGHREWKSLSTYQRSAVKKLWKNQCDICTIEGKSNQANLKEGEVCDCTDYVTNAVFANAVNILQAEFDTVATELKTLGDDFRVVEARLKPDHCSSSPCVNLGVCFNRLDGYLCECMPGYAGVNCQHADGPVVSKILRVDNGNTEGSWNMWDMCPTGSFARTFRIKLEEYQGSSVDDSAMNNILLYCTSAITWENTAILESGHGYYGTWRDWQDCPAGEFITGFKLKVEGDQGVSSDDSAVNGITTTCTGGSTQTGPIGTEGTFGSLASCPPGHAVCGLSTRIEPNQGGADDSGLNDVQMKCCAWR